MWGALGILNGFPTYAWRLSLAIIYSKAELGPKQEKKVVQLKITYFLSLFSTWIRDKNLWDPFHPGSKV